MMEEVEIIKGKDTTRIKRKLKASSEQSDSTFKVSTAHEREIDTTKVEKKEEKPLTVQSNKRAKCREAAILIICFFLFFILIFVIFVLFLKKIISLPHN